MSMIDRVPASVCRVGQRYLSPAGHRLRCEGKIGSGMGFTDEDGQPVKLPWQTWVTPLGEEDPVEAAPVEPVEPDFEQVEEEPGVDTVKGTDTVPMDVELEIEPEVKVVESTPSRVSLLVGKPPADVRAALATLDDGELADLGTLDGRLWLQAAIGEELERRGHDATDLDEEDEEVLPSGLVTPQADLAEQLLSVSTVDERMQIIRECSGLDALKLLSVGEVELQATVAREVERQIVALEKVERARGNRERLVELRDNSHMAVRPGARALADLLILDDDGPVPDHPSTDVHVAACDEDAVVEDQPAQATDTHHVAFGWVQLDHWAQLARLQALIGVFAAEGIELRITVRPVRG